jgi:signal transduction histidine kinase
MRGDWVNKLQHGMQVMAYCLAIATIQYAFLPERPYAPGVAYSIAIGMITWAIIDLGRDFFPSAAETGWPKGVPGVLLVAAGIVGGFLLGTFIADLACRQFGWYAGVAHMDRAQELRISILITGLAGITGSYYFYAQNRGAYLQRKMAEARRHADEARLKLLETQLEPHMLFNTLANLRALIAVDPQRAQQMLDHMIAYLRATLSASRSTTHPLQAEFERLRDYLALMAIRMGPRLKFAFELPPELEQRKVPTLLLQPLVENSIQHGLEPKVEGGTITVSARQEGQALVLEVVDTGVGRADLPDSGKGFGLAQIRERLATLYGDRAAIQFSAAPGTGARATITIAQAA